MGQGGETRAGVNKEYLPKKEAARKMKSGAYVCWKVLIWGCSIVSVIVIVFVFVIVFLLVRRCQESKMKSDARTCLCLCPCLCICLMFMSFVIVFWLPMLDASAGLCWMESSNTCWCVKAAEGAGWASVQLSDALCIQIAFSPQVPNFQQPSFCLRRSPMHKMIDWPKVHTCQKFKPAGLSLKILLLSPSNLLE